MVAYALDVTHKKLSPQDGLGYANSGATVAATASNNDLLADLIGNGEIPVNAQVASYLQSYGRFNASMSISLC